MNKDKSIKDLKQYNDKIKMQLEYAKIRIYNLEYEKESLNKIINELERWLKQHKLLLLRNGYQPVYNVYKYQEVIDKLKELKENK